MGVFRTISAIFSVFALVSTAALANPLPEGTYAGKIEFDQSSMEMKLVCAQEECQLNTVFVTRGGRPDQNSEPLTEITPVENLDEAQFALEYARSQRSARISKREFSELIQHLQPLLKSDLNFEQCFDVHYGGDAYSLVCNTAKSAWEKPSLLYLGSLLANCGEGFCRYVIYPLIKQVQ